MGDTLAYVSDARAAEGSAKSFSLLEFGPLLWRLPVVGATAGVRGACQLEGGAEEVEKTTSTQ
jgi:hypothetical protein